MRGRKNEFDVKTKNSCYRVRFSPSGLKYKLYVDGLFREEFAPASIVSRLFGDLGDYRFDLGGSEVVAAMRFGRLRIAVDGVYIDDGKAFVPVLPAPVWSSSFVGAALLPPVLFSGEVFDYLTAACCAYICTHYIIKNPDFNISMNMRIFFSACVVLASWAIFALFCYFERVV